MYTNALEPEATASDETEEEESGEKFSTVKRRMSPARSISVSESQATASETSSSPTDIKKPGVNTIAIIFVLTLVIPSIVYACYIQYVIVH